jgi:flagellar motor switch protein FliM
MMMEEARTAHRAQDNPFNQPGVHPDRLPGFAAIMDGFALALAKETEKLLSGRITCLVEGIDPMRLSEALSASRELPTGILFSPTINAHAYVVFDGQFGWMMIDACFSAASPGAAEDERRAPPRATSVGAHFIVEVARIAANALASAFSKVTPTSFRFERVEPASDAPIADRHDAPMLAARIAVKTTTGDARLVLLLPQSAIARLRHELSEAPPSDDAVNDPGWAREFGDALSLAKVEVAAVMEDLQLTLGEVSNLKVGRVLNLRGAGMGRVRLVCNGRDLFWCRLSQNDERYELEIE